MNGTLQTGVTDAKESTAWIVSVFTAGNGALDWWFDTGLGIVATFLGVISVLYILFVINPRKRRLLDLQIKKMENEVDNA